MFNRITASAALLAAALALSACNEADTTQNSADPAVPSDQTITNSTDQTPAPDQPTTDGSQAN